MTYLTKSKFLIGQRCHKRLWLQEYRPELGAPIDKVQQHQMKTGTRLGQIARLTYPNGHLITLLDSLDEQVRATQAAIAEGADILFEGTFSAENIFVKADILQKLPNQRGWHLIEVKSSKRVKKEHITDVAIQTMVLERAGLKISQVSIMHLNGDYLHPDSADLFELTEITDQIEEAEIGLLAQSKEMLNVLNNRNEMPQTPLGRQCLRPERCPFYDHCWQGITDPTIFDINNLHKTKEQALTEKGVFYLANIPEDFPLTPRQKKQVIRINQKKVEVNRTSIKAKIESVDYPLYFFDFETVNPALPWIPQTTPFEHVPFQFSLHIVEADGSISHAEYLHSDRTDPHQPLTDAILGAIGPIGSVVVYHAAFEKRVLEKLALRFPENADRLNGIIDRLWDLEKIFVEDYFHYRFRGKSSIKVVLPTLVPRLSYKNLAVQNGAMAQIAWLEMIDTPNGNEKDRLADGLKQYCWQDTMAMVEIFNHLKGLL